MHEGDPRRWTLRQALDRQVARYGERPYLNNLADGRRFSYRQLHDLAGTLAAIWRAQGIGHLSHVALFMDNSPEFVLSVFALGGMGAVWVPVNTASRGKLLEYYLELADITAVIVQDRHLAVVREALAKSPRVVAVIVAPTGSAACSAEPAPIGAVQEGVAFHAFPPTAAMLASAPLPWPEPCGEFSDLAALLFTSGTTGPSKANMWTQAGIHFYAAHNAHTREIREDDVEFVSLPLFHANALIHSTLTAFMAGASLALVEKFSASGFWDAVRDSGATRFNAIGAIANFLWSRPPGPDDRNHKVRLCSLAPVPAFVHGFEERFGVKVFTGYGLTDYGLATAGRPSDPPDKVMGCGRPREGVDVLVVDECDVPVPAGAPGEIIFRINHMWGSAIGYYKMPEETVRSRRNLWFHTGDRGYIDADGFLFFTDRLKDAIRRRGENISAFEVESIITSHPAVAQVAAFPVRAELPEDEVAVSVVLREGASLSAAELVDYCIGNMSAFMVPRFVAFAPSLPLTVNQKVEKYKLRQEAERDLKAYWDRTAAN